LLDQRVEPALILVLGRRDAVGVAAAEAVVLGNGETDALRFGK